MRTRRTTSAIAAMTLAAGLVVLVPGPARAADGDISLFAGSLGEGPATRVAVDSPGLALRGRTLFTAWNRPFPGEGAVVRAVDLDTGQSRVVAGSGLRTTSGDGGPATAAGIRHVGDLAVGPDGSLFVLDDRDHRVRRIDLAGRITTVAGGGVGREEGIRATAAELSGTRSIAVDAAGRLYIAESNRVRRVDASGTISTIAGGVHSTAPLGDGGPAVAARLDDPRRIAIDPNGNLYVAEGTRVRRVDQAGTIETVAGGGSRYQADGDRANEVEVIAKGLAFDAQGRLLIAAAFRISVLDAEGRLRAVGGTGESPFRHDGSRAEPGDGQQATTVPLAPQALITDSGGNLYTSELGRALVRRIEPSGVITTVAGNGTEALTGGGGPALQAQFLFPGTMVFDRAGNAHITDTQNRRVRVISPSGTITSLSERLEPQLLAVDDAGRLFVGTSTMVLRRDPDGTITEVAGGGSSPPVEGGLATAHRFDAVDIAADGVGNLYIADRWLGVYKVGADGWLATVAGTGSIAPTDGVPAALASLEVTSIEVDRHGTVYLADNITQRIWKVTGGLLTSVAGTTRGFGGDGGPATDARFDFWGPPMAVDGAGQLFVYDTENGRVRRIDTQGIVTTVAGSGEVPAQGAAPPSPVPGTPATFTPFAGGDIAIRGGDLYVVDTFHERVWKVGGVAQATPPAASPAAARALRASAWGHNGYGQLGATDLTKVVALAGGGFHSLALRSDGTVWSWGLGHAGQLGTGEYVQTAPAREIPRLGKVTAVAAGTYHSVALTSDGKVWAWGYNGAGQLGNGTTTHSAVPLEVRDLNGVVAIAAGSLHSLALRSDGTVWAWGLNQVGQLGTGGALMAPRPVQVPGLTGVRAIAAGWSHSLAVRADGSVMAWGWNTFGQLGDGTTTDRARPVRVTGLPPVGAVAGGVGHTLALGQDGSVWTWGLNNFGQLARQSPVVSPLPAKATGLTGVTSVVAGGHHSLAVRTDGRVASWGWNEVGQLGGAGLQGVRAVAGGYAHSVAGAP